MQTSVLHPALSGADRGNGWSPPNFGPRAETGWAPSGESLWPPRSAAGSGSAAHRNENQMATRRLRSEGRRTRATMRRQSWLKLKVRVYSRICGWVTSLTRGNRVGEHKEKSGRCPESRSSTAGGAGRCFLCIWD